MTKEEEHINQKIDNISDIDMYFDDSDLWNRLEERLDEKTPKKRRFLWLWSAVACLILGVFFLVDFNKKEAPQAVILPKEKIEIIHKNATKSTLKNESKKVVLNSGNDTQSADNQNIIEDEVTQKQLSIELNKLTFKDNFDTLSFNKKAITFQPKFKTEQVTIVDFPIIPDELMKREVFAKRLFRQIKSFNTEGKIDWRELNIEPRNVWAYLGRNFKYDTTSIQNKKHTKL